MAISALRESSFVLTFIRIITTAGAMNDFPKEGSCVNNDLSQDKLDTLFANAEGGDPIATSELLCRFGHLLKRESTTHGHVSDDLRQDALLSLIRELEEQGMIRPKIPREETSNEE